MISGDSRKFRETWQVCEVELEVNVEMSFSAFIIIIMITTN